MLFYHRINCKHELKCEFRHDQKGDKNIFKQISDLKKAVKERFKNTAKNQGMIFTLEQKVKEIKAEKQRLSDIIINLSAEMMVQLMCGRLESSKHIEPV